MKIKALILVLLMFQVSCGDFFKRGEASDGGGTTSDDPTVLAFTNDVAPLLTASCTGCHSNPASSYTSALDKVVAGSPATSPLYQRATGSLNHTAVWSTSSSQATTLAEWITSLAD